MADFCFVKEKIIDIEGGYSNNKYDLGKETKYGISKKSFPDLDIVNLTKEDALLIYKSHYWDKYKFFNIINQYIADVIFLSTINIPSATFKSVQKSINYFIETHNENLDPLVVDGVMGDKTFFYINSSSLDKFLFINRFKIEMINYYMSISQNSTIQSKNFLGWVRRVLSY